MLQTLERTNIFDARVLTAAHADALRALTGPGGLPLLPCLHPALEEGQIVGDYAGQDELQAAAALLPLYAEDPLPTSLRAAGYGADGQGAVLTPPILREDYTQLRHFLRLALRWATERYASYHVWAVLPLDLEHPEACDDLCAQYLSAGLTLRGMRPMAGADQMLIFSAHGLVQWRDPLRRCHLADPALPRVLERGYAAADFGWGKNGLELVLRPVWKRKTNGHMNLRRGEGTPPYAQPGKGIVGRPAHRPPRRFSSVESCRVVEDADPYRINHVRGCTGRCTGGMNPSPTN